MEKQIEKVKCELSRNPEFNLYQAFKMFDLKNRGHIEIEEFIFALTKITGKNWNRVLREQTQMIFRRYDQDQDGYLNYTEFCQLFLPYSDIQLQDILIARRMIDERVEIRGAAMEVLQRLLKAHLDLE